MAEKRLKAGVQYNDWEGTSAADDGDFEHAQSFLREEGELKESEELVGFQLFAGENHGSHEDPVIVTFLVSPAEGEPDEELRLREVQVEMDLAEFLGLFKWFNVVATKRGELDGRSYRATN